jgi:hypothetical protein
MSEFAADTQRVHRSKVLLGALDWLERNQLQFDPLKKHDGITPFNEIPLVELAVLCMCVKRQPAYSNLAPIDRLLDFIVGIYHRPAFRERLFRNPEEFVSHALLTVALSVGGAIEGRRHANEVQSMIGRGAIETITRAPHRMLELRYVLDLGGFSHDLPSFGTMIRHTVLAKPVDVTYVSHAEAYIITHVLFYLSNMGALPAGGVSRLYIQHAKTAVDYLLGMYLRVGDMDLVGELLLSAHCLRETQSGLYSFGWQTFTAAQSPEGFVPGRRYSSDKAIGLSDSDREEYDFVQCYHTTIVAGLVGAICPIHQEFPEHG